MTYVGQRTRGRFSVAGVDSHEPRSRSEQRLQVFVIDIVLHEVEEDIERDAQVGARTVEFANQTELLGSVGCEKASGSVRLPPG